MNKGGKELHNAGRYLRGRVHLVLVPVRLVDKLEDDVVIREVRLLKSEGDYVRIRRFLCTVRVQNPTTQSILAEQHTSEEYRVILFSDIV